ncbi:MAG: hypothetical protein WCB31_11120 [Nitrososphaeraceae archaeon]
MDLISILSSKELIASYVAIVGVFVSYITYRFNKKQLKQNQLSELIRSLNNPVHREARKVLYEYYEEKEISNISFQLLEIEKTQLNEYDDESKDAIIEISKNIVRSDLNHAGTLMHYKMIDPNVFLDEYWWIILNCWKILENDIKERRNKKNGTSNYMRNFEELRIKAEKFAKKKYPADLENFEKSYTK